MSRTALVTGANRGIGKEVCRQLADKGIRVILTGRRLDAAAAAADDLRGHGIVLPVCMDVSDPESVAACHAELDEQGIQIDILVNNAAVLFNSDSTDATETVKVNAVGPGWVRTEMGGENAPRDVEEGAWGIVRAATFPDDGPSGQIFRDDRRLQV